MPLTRLGGGLLATAGAWLSFGFDTAGKRIVETNLTEPCLLTELSGAGRATDKHPKSTNTALCEAGTAFFVGGGLVKALKNAEATAVARIFRQLVPLG